MRTPRWLSKNGCAGCGPIPESVRFGLAFPFMANVVLQFGNRLTDP
jgi:hypothetical protein